MVIGDNTSYQRMPDTVLMPPKTEPVETLVKVDSGTTFPDTTIIKPGDIKFTELPIDTEPLYRLELSDKLPETPKIFTQYSSKPQATVSESAEGAPVEPREPCNTCAERKYVDRSDDGGVSYQVPTKISSSVAAAKVMAHEREHVYNEQADADREGYEVLNQSVSLKYDCCPDCGSMFVAGGETRTTTSKEFAIGAFKSFDKSAGEGSEKSLNLSI